MSCRSHLPPAENKEGTIVLGVVDVGLEVGEELLALPLLKDSRDAITNFQSHSDRVFLPWCPYQTRDKRYCSSCFSLTLCAPF